MSENFKTEIISPSKTILAEETTEVIIPAFEGQMTILKDHISLITFLRPGFIEVKNKLNINKFYVDDGVVEFSKNILSYKISSLKELNQ